MSKAGKLSADLFELVVSRTPLISIDLIVKDHLGRVLVGKRTNRPAQGFWFVPGGRVLKNETLSAAFMRLTKDELGVSYRIEDVVYKGLYEHFYDDSALNEAISTHYVVNAFVIELTNDMNSLPQEQHSAYRWLSEAEFLSADDVHIHSKWYFMNEKGYLA